MNSKNLFRIESVGSNPAPGTLDFQELVITIDQQKDMLYFTSKGLFTSLEPLG